MSILDSLLNSVTGGAVKEVATAIERYVPSETQKQEWAIEAEKTMRAYSLDVGKILQEGDDAQTKVNAVEAANPSIFIAGWRPAIGWIGAVAMAYQFVLYPLLLWAQAAFFADIKAPPPLDTNLLWPVITGMLGIGTLRSFDKWQGVDTKTMGK